MQGDVCPRCGTVIPRGMAADGHRTAAPGRERVVRVFI
jgi:hypothetical protein